MKISVVICTKNEQKNIGRCLAAAVSIADEIIVMDSFSTDSTQEIVMSFPKVRFLQTDWKGFSQTKNYANSFAQFDYILSLDADEELSLELQQEILNLKSNLNGTYSINRMTNYCGQWIRHSGWFPDWHMRLFPKESAEWQGDFVHEKLKTHTNLPHHRMKGLVYHYSYYTVNEHQKRIESYSELGAREIIKRNKPVLWASVLFNPFARFMKCYVFKLGFLDGFYGLTIAWISAKAVFLKYSKAYKSRRSGLRSNR